MSDKRCKGCGHPMSRHVRNIEGDVICLCTWQHRNGGMIMECTIACDCLNIFSKQVEAQKQEQKRLDDEMFDYLAELKAREAREEIQVASDAFQAVAEVEADTPITVGVS